MKPLDIRTLKTVEQVDGVPWEQYAHPNWDSWVKNINYPVDSGDLDRICDLSQKADTVRLGWSMGELYFTRVFQRPLL